MYKHCIFGALLSLYLINPSLAACADSAPQIRGINYQQQLHSPSLPEHQTGIVLRTLPVQGVAGPSLGLYGLSNLPAVYAVRYGGRIAGATQVFAISATDAQVYHAQVQRAGSAPLMAQPSISDLPAQVGNVATYFNIDLAQHLQLPPESGRYHVFAWIDEFVSAMQAVDIPKAEKRAGIRPVTTLPATLAVATKPATATPPAKLTVHNCSALGETNDCIAVGLPKHGHATQPILLFQLCEVDRSLQILSAPLSGQLSSANQYTINIKQFARCAPRSARYLLANWGQFLSKPMYVAD